jgi:hypothetical protein
MNGMLVMCPVCNKPIKVGHSIRIERVEGEDARKVVHYRCDEPTIEIYRQPKAIVFSAGGKH